MGMVKADMSRFAVLVLAHGRPELSDTYDHLRGGGYTGRIIIVIDNEDEKAQGYIDKYGEENVYMFNKTWVAHECDSMNNFGNRKAILFARNESFRIARELGLESFVQMDDDYYYFGHRGLQGAKKTLHLDLIFEWFVEFLLNTPTKSIAFSQGGDHIGGWDSETLFKRKAMNSFFCLTSRPFKFYGVMNDDVNCYLLNGKRGDIFLSYMAFQLDQADTQSTAGGMTETYKEMGTYLKSFTSVMGCPSNVSIKIMGTKGRRLHHSIDWHVSVPMIVSEDFKKKD